MKLAQEPETETFRQELRAWLEANRPSPQEMLDRPCSTGHLPAWARAWQGRLFEAGWLMPAWPPEYGGRNATAEEEIAYFEEMAQAGVQRGYNGQGLSVVGPGLLVYGNTKQKEQFAVPTLRGQLSWCLGISEPNAGSDLGSLSTTANLHDDSFVVNGHKVWTSGAQDADFCWCLVRTDPSAPKHAGISVIMIDMRTPGISCRPLAQLDSQAHTDFNQVVFDDVIVPRDNLVGELNKGWSIAMGSVTRDRVMMWLGDLGTLERNFGRLRALASLPSPRGRRFGDDDRYRESVSKLYVDALAMKCMSQRSLGEYSCGQMSPTQSVLKVYGAEAAEQSYLTVIDLLGPLALEPSSVQDAAGDSPLRQWGTSWALEYLLSFVGTIGGGTVQVQRNIIATQVLGLPRS